MSEQTPMMSMSLEDAPPVETPPPAPPPDAPSVQAETPPNPDDLEPEGVIAAPTGEKYAPIKAVQEERAKRKEERQKREALEQEVAALKPRAEEFDRSKQYLEQAKPYIEALRSRPDLLHQVKQPPQAPPPQTDERAETYAKRFDLYTLDGKPDVARAQAILKDQDEQMERIAQKTVAPLVQTEAQRQSVSLYQRYLNTPEINGVKIDPKFLSETWGTVPPELIAQNPNVAEVLFRTAFANQIMSGHKPTPAPPPVITTESVGPGKPTEQSLTSQSEKFLSASGIKREHYVETRNAYKPGQNNSLE